MIDVVAWGIATSVVNGGVTGQAWLGAPRGGAVDVPSLALANRVVGNPPNAPALETSGGLVLRFRAAAMVCLCGAVAEITVAGGPPVGWGGPVVLPAGAQLRVGRLLDGARVYVALRGGVTSAAGASGVTARLQVGADPGASAASAAAPRHPPRTTIRLWPGPRQDWFTPAVWQALLTHPYVVGSTSRVGTRLVGPALLRSSSAELPSEGLLEGAVQVPHDGQPIIMLADHPTTGGYPVIAVVDPDDIEAVAQAAAGSTLRFTIASAH
ncbi:MAG: biotin-dependent carboxyltransferase family protein [Actinomycetota bacterium]|nr:biotin-dependent carboxyltransferase family protein [Actinomycetota bacterium]